MPAGHPEPVEPRTCRTLEPEYGVYDARGTPAASTLRFQPGGWMLRLGPDRAIPYGLADLSQADGRAGRPRAALFSGHSDPPGAALFRRVRVPGAFQGGPH